METDNPITQNTINNNMDEEGSIFERSINSKWSDWTSVFDSNADLEHYKFCWSPNESPGSKSPNADGHRSRDSLLSESVMFEKVVKAREQLHQIFEESCTALYNDIQRSFESWDIGQEVYLNDLLEREALIRAHAEQLAELAPEMSELIGLKLASLSRSLEQLRLKHESDSKMGYPDRSAATHLRKWLQKTEFKLEQLKEDISLAAVDLIELQRLRVSLQVVQLEIESEGRQLIQVAKRYSTRKALEWTTDTSRIQRLKLNLEALETRWYNLCLSGGEALEQINTFIERSSGSGDESSDVESIGSSEPLRKRRRRSIEDSSFPFDLGHPNLLRAESEEEDEDTIPFGANEYESIMTSESQASDVEYENHRGQLVANRSAMVSTDDSLLDTTPTGLENRTSSAEDGWSSSGKTHDVGYSSGENSVHEALNSIGSESPNPTEATQTDAGDLQRMRTQTSPINIYYRTVPLDDCGITDNETPRFVPALSLNLVEDSDSNGNPVLSESLVVHAGDNSDDSATLGKDYKEVMRIMDDSLTSTNSMRMGTSWKELKNANSRRLSATPSKWSSVGRMGNRRSLPTAAGKMSCDASSEDSDYATNNGSTVLPSQLSVSFNGRASNLLTVPSNAHSQPQMMQRKRRHQRQAPNSISKMTTSLNSSILKNLAMDQSVYEPMNCDNEEDIMSQSLNLPSMMEKGSRKRVLRRRMRRTASDNTDLGFHIVNLIPQGPLNAEQKHYPVERRNSMESNSSSTTTFHESGDAHFEWDEYREEPLTEDVPMAPNTSLIMNGLNKHPKHPSSVMPILSAPDVDDDFQTELPFIDVHDNMGVNAFLSQSKDSLDESYRLLQNHRGNEDALKLNAISVGRIAIENLRRIRAIMRSNTILDMQCLDEFEKLHAAWLELIGSHKIPADDTLSAAEVGEVMALFRKIREYYLLFGQTCGQPDAEFVSHASMDELKTRLNLRKESFIELQKLHEKMANTVRQFSELQPDLDRVSANINLLSRSVANLDCFYQIGDIRELLKNLYKRLDDVTIVVNRLSNGKNGAQINDHKVENQLRRIDSELSDCQNRMSSLETACNSIIAWMNQNTNELGLNIDEDEIECMKKIISQFGETKSEVNNMRNRFDDLMKAHCPDLFCRPNSQLNEDSYSDSSVSKFSTSEVKLRRRRHSSEAESVDLQTASTSNGKVTTNVKEVSQSSATYTSSIRQNPTARTLFSCLILMGFGLILLYMATDDEIFSRSGHWRFKFGPQLKYIAGPSPF